VLVPLYVDAGQLWVVLTRRSDELPQHRSQIAFPGGGLETGETAWAAALRESREELGLEPRQIVLLGELDEIRADVSNYRIVPCVGAVPYPLATAPNPAEIAEVFTVPLLAFADPRLVEERIVVVDGKRRRFHIYHVGNRTVWGLTARIVHGLLQRLDIA
jgi:8-oxo-dGTP pyrophosphatase MutT (NUDIX family)